MEVSSDYYLDIMKSLIRPVNLDESMFVSKKNKSSSLATSAELSINDPDRTAKRISMMTQIGMKFGSL